MTDKYRWLNLSALELSQGGIWACAKCGTVRFGNTFDPCPVCALMDRVEQLTEVQAWVGR